MKPYVGDSIPGNHIETNSPGDALILIFPWYPISQNISTLELFHGPTLAFKDVGARFMSRCLGYFMKDQKHVR